MLRSIVQIVAPRLCLICEVALTTTGDQRPAGVCDLCRERLVAPGDRERSSHTCRAESTDGQSAIGGLSAQHSPAMTVVFAFSYRPPVQNLIKDFKFRGRLDVGAGLADELARVVTSHPNPDAMVPVPLHPRRLRERGFNQATEIAKRLQIAKKLPILINNIQRNTWLGPQTGLDTKARARNVAGAFSVERSIPPHVAIIDDVITSGATTGALMTALGRRGARRFQVWALAHAVIR